MLGVGDHDALPRPPGPLPPPCLDECLEDDGTGDDGVCPLPPLILTQSAPPGVDDAESVGAAVTDDPRPFLPKTRSCTMASMMALPLARPTRDGFLPKSPSLEDIPTSRILKRLRPSGGEDTLRKAHMIMRSLSKP